MGTPFSHFTFGNVTFDIKDPVAPQQVSASGNGNAVTSVTLANGILSVVKGSTFLTSVPAADSSNYGGIKLGYSQNNKNYPVVLDGNGKAYVNVPWTGGGTATSLSTRDGDWYLNVSSAKLQNANDENASEYGVRIEEGEIIFFDEDSGETYSINMDNASNLPRIPAYRASSSQTYTLPSMTTAQIAIVKLTYSTETLRKLKMPSGGTYAWYDLQGGRAYIGGSWQGGSIISCGGLAAGGSTINVYNSGWDNEACYIMVIRVN